MWAPPEGQPRHKLAAGKICGKKKMSPDNECTVVLFRKGLFLKWDSKDTRGNQETPNEDVDDVSRCSYIIETQKDITQVNERLATKYMMLHNLRTTKRICNPEQKKHKSLKYHSLWLKTCVCLFDRVWPWVSEAGCLEFWADFIPYLVKSSSRLTSESDLVSFIQWRQLQFNSHSAWVVTGCDQSFRFIWPVQYVIKHTQATFLRLIAQQPSTCNRVTTSWLFLRFSWSFNQLFLVHLTELVNALTIIICTYLPALGCAKERGFLGYQQT